jgi:hypothetical protein
MLLPHYKNHLLLVSALVLALGAPFAAADSLTSPPTTLLDCPVPSER